MANKRIDWTEYELSQVYSATLDVLKNNKVKTPPTDWQGMSRFMKAMRDAQVVLPENRRRPLANMDAISKPLLKRFQENGFLPSDLTPLRKGGGRPKAAEDKVDPKLEQIKSLQEENTALKEVVGELKQAVVELQGRPTPAEMMQKWISDTLADAIRKAGLGLSPGEPKARMEPLPAFERERRKDPGPTPGTAVRKPKYALVADFVGSDKNYIHSQLSGELDLRYIDSSTKFDGLPSFNGTGGKVVVWTSKVPHEWVDSLKSKGISPKFYTGTLSGLITFLKREVEIRKGLL